MKKVIIAIIVAILVASFAGCSKEEQVGNDYEVSAIVVGVNKQEVRLNVDMPDGSIHGWIAYGSGYQQGQLVKLTMNDAGTPQYSDDTIERMTMVSSL